MTARKPDVLCVALRNVLQRSRLEGKDPGRGHHAAAVRAARRVQRRLDEAPLPRAVRELLRDVVLADYLDNATNDPKDAPLVAVWLASDGMLGCARRAAKLLGTTPAAIVARARKVRK